MLLKCNRARIFYTSVLWKKRPGPDLPSLYKKGEFGGRLGSGLLSGVYAVQTIRTLFSALSNEQSELGCPNFDSVYTTCWETIFGSLLFNNVMWRGYCSVSLAQCEKVFILYLITVHVDMKNYSVQHAQRHSLCSYGTKAPYATGRMLKSQYLYHSLRGMISLTNRNKAPG